jgi:hypothetical protein
MSSQRWDSMKELTKGASLDSAKYAAVNPDSNNAGLSSEIRRGHVSSNVFFECSDQSFKATADFLDYES